MDLNNVIVDGGSHADGIKVRNDKSKMNEPPQKRCADSGNESDDDFVFDEDDEGEAAEACSKQKGTEDVGYRILPTEKIMKDMNDCIAEVSNVLQLRPTVVRILLNHFRWDEQKLLEIFFDTDLKKLSKKVGVTFNVNSGSAVRPSSTRGAEDCQICFCEYPYSKMFGMGCGHRYCKLCWTMYLRTKILDEGSEVIICIDPNCKVAVDDDKVMELLQKSGSDIQMKFNQLISNSYVKSNILMKWCPSPGCTSAVRFSSYDTEMKPVTCSCSHTFCFRCSSEWHAPVGCELLKTWHGEMEKEKKTLNWIAVNTKECPKCKSAIEKNGGCNHMLCRSCRVEFCWACLQDWAIHNDNYNCNRYPNPERAETSKVKADLDRYNFYIGRYENHHNSLKMEKGLYDKVGELIVAAIENHGCCWNSMQYLREAVDTLCKCRQTLMYTYTFAYFAEKNNQTEIFENNQRDLEYSSEKLSAWLEREIELDRLSAGKQTLIDMERYCETRRNVLLDHVREGRENGWWKDD